MWISPGDSAAEVKGSGRATDPYRVASGKQFDQIFRDIHLRAVGAEPTAFRLMPGKYFTRGCWAHPNFATLWRGDALIGSTDVVIALADPVTETDGKQRPDLHVLSAGSPWLSGYQCRVENLRIDGGFNDGAARKGRFVTSAFRAYGTGVHVSSVEVDGIGGSIEPVPTPSGAMPLEAFGISFEMGAGGRVRDCVVRSSTLSKRYVSAFSAAGASPDGVVFEDCLAIGQEDHAAFTVYDGTVVRNCRAAGFGYGIYNDTGSARRVLVDGGHFEVGRVGVGCVAVKTFDQKHGFRIRDARFVFGSALNPVGIELIAKPGWDGIFQDFSIGDCRFEADEGGVFTIISTDAPSSKLVDIRIVDCVFPDPARLNVPEGNAVELFGNRNWAGEYFMAKANPRMQLAGAIAGAEK